MQTLRNTGLVRVVSSLLLKARISIHAEGCDGSCGGRADYGLAPEQHYLGAPEQGLHMGRIAVVTEYRKVF